MHFITVGDHVWYHLYYWHLWIICGRLPTEKKASEISSNRRFRVFVLFDCAKIPWLKYCYQSRGIITWRLTHLQRTLSLFSFCCYGNNTWSEILCVFSYNGRLVSSLTKRIPLSWFVQVDSSQQLKTSTFRVLRVVSPLRILSDDWFSARNKRWVRTQMTPCPKG